LWKVNGKKYTQKINDDNSKSAEADFIIAYAQKKRDAKNFIKKDAK
jgi:hypothetical protein